MNGSSDGLGASSIAVLPDFDSILFWYHVRVLRKEMGLANFFVEESTRHAQIHGESLDKLFKYRPSDLFQ
jgi:hypothetical protein